MAFRWQRSPKLSYYIGIEDLAANALIELLTREQGTREVSFEALSEYGFAVVRVLNRDNRNGVLVLSRERTRSFIRECSDIFEVEGLDGAHGKLVLKEGVGIDLLIDRFCGTISIYVLRAMADQEAVEALLKAVA